MESSPQVAGGQDQGSSGDTGFEQSGKSGSTAGSVGNTGMDNSAGTGSQSGSQSGGFETAGSGSSGSQNSSSQSGGFDGSQAGGDDPFGDLSSGNGQVMTAAERRAALDARLDEGFAEFDGMILGERERVQAQADEAGSGVMSGGGSGSGESNGQAPGRSGGPLVIASGPQTAGGGIIVPTADARQGDFDNSQNNEELYPVPQDIPSGSNDDVVARQLREAAMREPDPELREKLWDEYRAYTGIGQ